VPGLDQRAALEWIAKWDEQQEENLPDREDRFTTLIDAVEEGTGRPDPLVLDLGCGPGSLSVRLLDRIPAATVVAVDADPLLLTLGRAAYGERGGRLRDPFGQQWMMSQHIEDVSPQEMSRRAAAFFGD
jgi:SAM-dependent methyltransferase